MRFELEGRRYSVVWMRVIVFCLLIIAFATAPLNLYLQLAIGLLAILFWLTI